MLKRSIAEFRPGKKGLSKVLGHLEAAVMEIIWRQGQTSVRDVYETLRLDRDIAYTTVMTIMSRLAEKRFLHKQKQGLAYVYSPVCTQEEFTCLMVREVIDGLLEDYADAAFSHFVQRLQEKDDLKIKELEQIIRERQLKGEQ